MAGLLAYIVRLMRTFRVQKVANAISQTVLRDVRLGKSKLQNVAIDQDGHRLLVRTDQHPDYLVLGVAPTADLAYVRALRTGSFRVQAKVVGGGVSIRAHRDGPEFGRYGSMETLPQHVREQLDAHRVVAIGLTHGLELTFIENSLQPDNSSLNELTT